MRGTPAQDESDPSLVLSFIAPILFGFMFGDVGQGLVIFVTGLVFRRRWPLLAILVPGGLAAIAFGAAFGSVFCREDLLPALWLRPLAEPLTLLAASIVIGIGVLSIGLLFDAMQAHWRGEVASWWQRKAGLVLTYYALIAAPLRVEALWCALFGVLWYLVGAASAAGGNGRVQSSPRLSISPWKGCVSRQHGLVRARRRLCSGPCGIFARRSTA